MPLRARLELVPETIQEVEAAAEEMFRNGKFLVQKKRFHTGIYLLGYTAEMLLKTAYFRLTGATATDLVFPRLGPARTLGANLTPSVPYENYHSLQFWARLIEQERRAQSKSALPQEFRTRIDRLYDNWWVEMRYIQANATTTEAETLLRDVRWLIAFHTRLWS